MSVSLLDGVLILIGLVFCLISASASAMLDTGAATDAASSAERVFTNR